MSVLALSRHGRALSDISRASKPAATAQLDEQRSFLSRFLVLWVGPLLVKGSRTNLVFEDLPALKQKHRSPELLRDFKPEHKSSLLWNLIWHYKCGIFLAILTKLGSQILDYMNPLLLSLLIDHKAFPKVPPLTRGISIAVLMLVVSELKSLLLTAHAYIVNRDAAMTMSILSNNIVKKSLRISMESRNEWTSSRISNLVTVDLEAVAVAAPFGHFLWAAVVEVCIALTFIYHTIGTPGVGAVIVMVAYIPANVIASRIVRILQKKQMEWKDRRVTFTKEVVMGLKMVKVFAWENPFEEEILKLRTVELSYLRRSLLISRVLQAMNSAAPFIVPIVCFSWFVLVNPPGSLTPQVAFVCLVVFNMLRRPMANIAPSIQYCTKALVSLKRIDQFLKSGELQHDKKPDDNAEPQNVHVALKHAYFTWKAEKEHLKDITIEVEEGGFHAIVGPVGSGKSSVLGAVIGDLILLDGVRSVHGTMAYAPQVPWIMNSTVKANILYGKEFDKNLYDKVVRSCELRKDFYQMSRYDSTIVGDNGMALSGGQRARIALARALYQDCDIYLLDDPFSALDPSVRKSVFDAVLGPKGLLAKKTVLLTTHDTQLVKTADMVYVINDGKIEDSGSFEELCESSDLFSELRRESEKNVDETKKDDSAEHKKKKPKAVMFEPPELPAETKTEVQQGKMKSSVYMTYLRAFSFHWAIAFVVLIALRYFLQGCSGMWLSTWSDHNTDNMETDETRMFFLHVYVAIGAVTIIISIFAFVVSIFGGVRASRVLHEPLISALLRAPISFFEKTPFGRILNRFTGDMDVIDNPLPINIRLVVDCLLNIAMVLVVISVNIPFFLVFVLPFAAAYMFLLKRFIAPTRQIRRIESAKRSSLLSSITEVVAGASSIRAFGRVKMTCLQLQQDVDAFTRCRYLQPATQRWLSLRMEFLGNIMIFICAVMVSVFHHIGWISVGSMGLCISYALTLTETMNFSVRMMVLSETNIVAVERIKEYHEILPEGEWKSEYPLVEAWPHSGAIEVRKLEVSYGRGTHALQDVSFSIKGGERIGIVGRTGSGKSSLLAALLRLVEPSAGDIKVDGVNLAEIGLHELRSRFTYIPQEPVLFSSSLRFNLDPFNEYADSDLWLALEACQLKDVVRKNKSGLHWHLEEGGGNLSVGERQLVCLCRALLKGGQVLILDEATAAVDRPTERLLHQVVADFFKHSTTIIVAHRLETIEDCDRLLVLDQGRVLDFDSPKALMEKKDSLFRELAQVD